MIRFRVADDLMRSALPLPLLCGLLELGERRGLQGGTELSVLVEEALKEFLKKEGISPEEAYERWWRQSAVVRRHLGAM